MKKEVERAISEGDADEVKHLLERHPHILRGQIKRGGYTPMHMACASNKLDVVKLLVEEEEKRIQRESSKGTPTRSYNMTDENRSTPVFLTTSAEIVEFLLHQIGELEVMKVGMPGKAGWPLLGSCIFHGIVTKNILGDKRMRRQAAMRWNGVPMVALSMRIAAFDLKRTGGIPLQLQEQSKMHISSCIELVGALKHCDLSVKAMSLRAIMAHLGGRGNIRTFTDIIVNATTDLILSWMDDKGTNTGLTDEEDLRLRAFLMKARENDEWFDPNNSNHRKLLWLFCCDGNLEMVMYMLSLPGIRDPMMEDGTTAFSMAIARNNSDLIQEFLSSYEMNYSRSQEERVRDELLAKQAILEPKIEQKMKVTIKEILKNPSKSEESSALAACGYFERQPHKKSEQKINLAIRFPFFNEDSELHWKENNSNKVIANDMKREIQNSGPGRAFLLVQQIEQFIVPKICFSKVKGISLPFVSCRGKSICIGWINCSLVDQMLCVVRKIERSLNEDGTMKQLRPKFTLAGSIIEGTRFGYANELDIGLSFEALKTEDKGNRDNIAFQVYGDPFTLKKANTSQSLVDCFFNKSREFQLLVFKQCLLEITGHTVREMFEAGENPPNLQCITTNQDWDEGNTPCRGECKRNLENRNYEQCEKCAVAVSQTKIGIALQFVWKWKEKEIYCSIDIIPEYPIVPIPAIELAKFVNIPMLEPYQQPESWLSYMGNYDKHYKINLTQGGLVHHIVLKEMNFLDEKNHHVRPAQPSNEEDPEDHHFRPVPLLSLCCVQAVQPSNEEWGTKFTSERMRKIYCYIKFLKKNSDGIKASSYWVKKELQKQHYEEILDSCKDDDNRALIAVLMQPEFRMRMEEVIDLEESFQVPRILLRR